MLVTALQGSQIPKSCDYPPRLKDEFAIASYIIEHATSDVDEELVEEYFRGAHGVLRKIPLGELQPGNSKNNTPSPAKERRYARMNPDTMPPLVVENGTIADGNHRYRVLVARGAEAAWCYEIVSE